MGSPVTSGMVGIEQLHTGLTVHKVMARAKGLLMSKRELSESAARRWLQLETTKTGQPIEIVAAWLIADLASDWRKTA